jgi:transposase
VSEQNLQAIRKRGGQYLVGTPRSQMKQFEQELLKDDWTKVRPDVEVKKVPIPQGEATYILCRTAGRKEKEKAIRSRFSARMENALKRLTKTIETGRLKDRNKMERRLGRIQASHPQVSDLYDVALRETREVFACSGPSKRTASCGTVCANAPTCYAPICRLAQPKNCGHATCS